MASVKYCPPAKKVFDAQDLGNFKKSIAYERLHTIINLLVEKVKGADVPKSYLDPSIVTRGDDRYRVKDNDLPPEIKPSSGFSHLVNSVLEILQALNVAIDDTPPLEGPRRFGNLARRDWQEKVEKMSRELLKKLTDDEGLITELDFYLVSSFGSSVRLDYGSGHELSFMAFVGGLLQANIIDVKEIPAGELLAIFASYYDLARRLILVYSLEPAGSHGVWGLDDHFHFIYILGAAQFNGESSHRAMIPSVALVLTNFTIEDYKEVNLYVNAIAFIFKIKLGPFHEHSPIIFDIHKTVTLWPKVLSGLLKMYEVEVFNKFPVVQHFWFGKGLYPWVDINTNKEFPVREPQQEKNDEPEDTLPGLINGYSGTKTTRNNITLTQAPWARGQPALRGPLPPR